MVAAGLIWLAVLAQEGAGSPEGFHIRFLHEASCEALKEGKGCRKERHWKFGTKDQVLGGFPDMVEALDKEAEAHRAGAPRPELSERVVFLGGSPLVPWGMVSWTMRQCAQAGIYKIAWLKPGSEKEEMVHKFVLRDPEREPTQLQVADPEIVLRWDDAQGGLIRRVGHRTVVTSLDQMVAEVRQTIARLKEIGKSEFPVRIDAGEDVPWKHVIEVLDRCRSEGLENLEFVPKLRRKAAAAEKK